MVLQIIEARTVNECRAVCLAGRRFTPNDVKALDTVLDDTSAALERHDTGAMMLLDKAFHSTIARASGNPVFFDILSNLHDQAVRFWFISLEQEAHQDSVLQEPHRPIRDQSDRPWASPGSESDCLHAALESCASALEYRADNSRPYQYGRTTSG